MRSRSAGRSSTAGAAAMSRSPPISSTSRCWRAAISRSVERFGASRDGVASVGDLQAASQGGSRQGRQAPLVALMAANNETGVIQPVREAAELAHAAGGLLHVDAVQALGKILLDIKAIGRRSSGVSAHKIGGPMGVGALVLGSDRLHVRWLPFRRRPGAQPARRHRESWSGIAGFGCRGGGSHGRPRRRGAAAVGPAPAPGKGLRAIWPDTIIFGEKASPGGSPIRCNSRSPASRRRPP